jgi:hypothetical protein
MISDERYSFPCITDVSKTFLRNHLRDRILELLPCGLCKLWLSMSIGNLKSFAEALGLEDGMLLIILGAAGCIVRSDKDEWVQGVFTKIIPIQHEKRKYNNIRYLRFKLTDGCELNTQSAPIAFENVSCPEDNYQPKYKAEFEAVREQYGLTTSKSLSALVSINDGSIHTKSVVQSPTSSPSSTSTAVHDMKLLYDTLSSEQRKQLCELYLQDAKPQNFEVTAKNYRQLQYFKFSKMSPLELGLKTASKEQLDHIWRNYLNNSPTDFLTEFLEKLYGTKETGVYLLARHMHLIDEDAALTGMKDGGATVIRKPLTAEETLGLQFAIQISEKHVREIASYLEYQFDCKILAPHHECQKLLKELDATREQMHFGKYEYIKDHIHHDIDNWMIDPIEVLKTELYANCVSASRGYKPIGIDHGINLGNCITICYHHDKGGGSWKSVMMTKLHSDDRMTNVTPIGYIDGKLS